MQALELLAPARTADIGIAAIDCGADAVYIAGPAFGARQNAGNSLEEIARLCRYAHRFGARIFATVNTIVYEDELPEVRSLVQGLAGAGVDALIVQDPAVAEMARETGLVLHASTQCAIRTREKARLVESLGYGRLVLERQLSLGQIRAIRAAVDAELECFVHGALCVCYSGECYLSEALARRSANRGACAQACRSRYDLEDASGKVLLKDKAVLSLKDLNLIDRLQELADAGVQSFKIEGRLKGESYVRNVTKAYSDALDALVAQAPERYCRASFGRLRGGFVPRLDKTFNRGYTRLFLDGERGSWAAMDAPKSMGEYVGTVKELTRDGWVLEPAADDIRLENGDGFAFVNPEGGITGFRADVCEGLRVRCKRPETLRCGTPVYRNVSAAFERTIDAARPVREIPVALSLHIGADGSLEARACSEDGRVAQRCIGPTETPAREEEKMLRSLSQQLGKRSGHYAFQPPSLQVDGPVPFLPLSELNALRRDLAADLDALPVQMRPLQKGREDPSVRTPETLDYRANIANSLDRALYSARGADRMEEAYELRHPEGVELMRSKYCVRYELGLCPRQGRAKKAEPLYLRNGGRRLRLDFHCELCEMSVR